MKNSISPFFESAQDLMCIVGFDGYSNKELLSKSLIEIIIQEDWETIENV